jgi:chemosensory pili system protein ChpA (sensor histidine kinase/response regulator)
MLDEIRDPDGPGVDIQELMEQATTLANGKQLDIAVEHAFDDEEMEEVAAPEAAVEVVAAYDEPSLLEIFSNESREHLQTINEWVAAYSAPGQVSDGLYRALHTLSGISESADVPAIGRLADGLYNWFGAIHEDGREVGKPAYEVLRDCANEMSRMVDALPEKSSDETVLDILCTRIEALPPVENVAEYAQPPVDVTAIVEASAAEELPVEPNAEALPAETEVIDTVDLQEEPNDETASDESVSAAGDAEPVDAMPATDSHDEADEHAKSLQEEPEYTAKTDESAAMPEDFGEQETVAASASEITESADPDEVTLAADESTGDEEFEPVIEEAAPETAVAEDAADIEEIPAADEVAAVTETAKVDPYADMDPELYEIFVEESSEVIEASEAALRSWSKASDDRDSMEAFQRHLHTLKGSARMMDLEHIGNLSHAVESLMTEVTEDRVKCSPELFGLLADAHDRLADMVEKVRNRELTDAATGLEAGLQVVIEGGDVPEITTESAPEPEESIEAQSKEPAEAQEEPSVTAEEPAEAVDNSQHHVPFKQAPEQPESLHRATPPRLVADDDKQAQTRGEQVKVQSEMLDNMVNHAGEINIYRARMEQQISDYRFNLSELDQTINRLREQLRQLEMETEAQILHRYEQESDQRNADFDPLEMDRYSNLQQLSRSLIESISDLSSLQDLMENTTRDSETLLLQQSRVSTELQENLIRTRMIPFVSLSPRLRRIARQAARQLDKKVEVSLVGEDGEMDRAVVERIIAPLEHMLRNSVAHGIELPRVRKAAGKPVTGNIDIEFERDGSEIVLRITDDGAGMNIEAIRNRAVERGMITAEADLPDEDIIQFVLQTGFSTASEVTQISGRGVGMDVVNSEVKQLGGSLHIESEYGKGATFTVRLPYTLAINQGMLVTAGDETFCVPLASVEGVVRFYPEELRECYNDGQQLFEYGSNEYRLRHLASLLETGNVVYPGEREQVPVLLVRAGEKRIGFHVEDLQGIREVVIKPVGPQLSTVDGISGATILGDGRVVMILDMVAVSRREIAAQPTTNATRIDQTGGELVVMVVDDSITVRKVTTRLLERNGYKVVTAKDGVDAMGKLQESAPDIMLLDIEMPRMDGFELATHMRNDDNLRHVPIIMITSRTGDKHRERAEQIGVQRYLGKPYQESDLLDSIHQIIGVTGEMAEG